MIRACLPPRSRQRRAPEFRLAWAQPKRVKKVVLELGGSDPFIVMPSANMDEAVANAVKARISITANPASTQALHSRQPIAEEFQKRFVKTMQDLKVGDPLDNKTDLGPLSDRRC